jgi:hypothetical protein
MRLRALIGAASLALLVAACGSSTAAKPRGARASGTATSTSVRSRSSTRRQHASPAPVRTTQHRTAQGPATDRAAIRRAAAKLRAAPGYAFKLSARVDSPILGGVATMTGQGSFDRVADTAQITANIKPPGALGFLGEVETQILISGGDVYVLMPDSLDGSPIGGHPWGEATFTELEAATGTKTPGTLGGLLSALPDSAGAKVWLRPRGTIRRAAFTYDGTLIRHLWVAIRVTGVGAQPRPQLPAPSAVGGLLAAAASLGL